MVRRLFASKLRWFVGLGLVGAIAAPPALSAEVLSVLFGTLKVSLPVRELEVYATKGELTGELKTYASLIKPQQLAEVRQALQQKLTVNPKLVTQLAKSKTGQIVLNRIGGVVQTGSGGNGGESLRNAVIRAADAPEGLTILNLLRYFPEAEIKVNVEQGVKIANEASRLFNRNTEIANQVEKLAAAQVPTNGPDFSRLPDLTKPGTLRWQRHTISITDATRKRSVPIDVYLPPRQQGPAPIVLISHGLASNRNTFDYLAKHLASHGIAVAIPEHVGSNATKFQQFFDGVSEPPNAKEAIDRPRDLSFTLDTLTQLNQTDPRFRNRLDLNRVGAIGQSLGALTVMLSAGAELNFDALDKACTNSAPSESFLNISMILQCRLQDLKGQTYTLKDDRIKAILAINPVTSQVLGPKGLQQIQVPTMFVAGSADLIVPSVDEQFYPFSWLSVTERYLVLMKNATHFSTLAESGPNQRALPLPSNVVGPVPEVAQRYLSALSLAFLQTHVLGNKQAKGFLTPAYAQFLSRPEMPLSLLPALNSTDLDRLAAQAALALPN